MALSKTRRLQADFSNSIAKVKIEILRKVLYLGLGEYHF